jgi:hypothetical protein
MYKRECPLFMRGENCYDVDWGKLLGCKIGSLRENCYDVDWIHENTLFVNLLVED